MQKREIIKKIIINSVIWGGILIIYWLSICLIDIFFHSKNVNLTTLTNAMKLINNFWYALVLSFFSIVIYWFFLFHLRLKNWNKNSALNNKSRRKITKEFKKLDTEKIIFLNKKVGLVSQKLNQHTLLIGGSGYGKTTTALTIIKQLHAKLKQKVIIIDGKGDHDLINKIKTIDSNSFIWSIGGEHAYNPLATKNNVILSDKIMSLFNFSEAHYQAMSHNYLLFLIRVLIKNGVNVTFENIVKYFPIKALRKLISDKGDNDFEILLSFETQEKDIQGLQHRLNVYLQQLGTSFGGENSLSNLLNKHDIILFSLNSFKYPELATNVGKLLIQDLKEFATIKPQDQVINLVLDEFNVFVTDAVINLVNKSRSHNFQCFLSFQTIKDLELNNKNIADIIFGNTANIIAHKTKDPNTAEYVAKVFGTKTEDKLTKQYDQTNKTGRGSIREVEEYIVHPNELKNLKTGEAICQVLLPSTQHLINKTTITSY